jgi:hypothetical protein
VPTAQTVPVTNEWEGGERQGFNWLRAGIVLLVLAVAGLWWLQRDRGLTIERDGETVGGPSELPDVVVTSPLKAGDRWYCPSSHPIRAYAENTLYYPGHYPTGGGIIARPDECYADTERAEAAGYILADPPAGSVVAGGVYVIPAVAPGRAACAQLAIDTGVAVPCPTMLPAPATGPSCTEARCFFQGGIVIEQRIFDASDEYCAIAEVDGTSCDTHVMVTAVPGTNPSHLVACPAPPGEGEDLGSVTATPRDDALADLGARPQLATCGEGPPWIPGIGGVPHEGHTVARWQTDGHTFAVSVEGHGEPQTDLLHAILDGIEVCMPRPEIVGDCEALSG